MNDQKLQEFIETLINPVSGKYLQPIRDRLIEILKFLDKECSVQTKGMKLEQGLSKINEFIEGSQSLSIKKHLQDLFTLYRVAYPNIAVSARETIQDIDMMMSPEQSERYEAGIKEYNRMQQRCKDNVINNFGYILIDPLTQEKQRFANQDETKTELFKRIDLLREEGYITLLPPPGNDLYGVVVQIQHPQLNNNIPEGLYVAQRVDFERLTGAPTGKSFSKINSDFADQDKLNIYLISIVGYRNDPSVIKADLKILGEQQINYTKCYLQELHKRSPNFYSSTKEEKEKLIDSLGAILGIPQDNQKLQLLAFQKILGLGGSYYDGDRGCVDLFDNNHRFYSYDKDFSHASLLLSL